MNLKRIVSDYKKRTIVRDLASGLALIIVVVVVSLSSLGYFFFVIQTERDLDEQATNTVENLADILAVPVWYLDETAIAQIAEAYQHTDTLVVLRVLDNAGVPMYESITASEGNLITKVRPIDHDGTQIAKVEISLTKQHLLQSRRITVYSIIVLTAVVVLTVTISAQLLLHQFLTQPLARLAQGIDRITGGDYDHPLPSVKQSNIDVIVQKVNVMAAQIAERDNQLRTLISTLEQRVAERAAESAWRSTQLEIAGQVARDAISVLDPKELLEQVTILISEAFGFYHAGIFLLDERGEWAVLEAASSADGRRMLARGHRLRVGQEGIVGYVTAQNKARIALDVDVDSLHFQNPDLPNTRSEMALPLQVHSKVLGALDVQSVIRNAFSNQDVAVLQTMADQIAIAIHNARLFEQTEQAKEAAETANRAKSAFLANMSHELRSPLNAILGFTQLMHRDLTFPSSQQKNLRIIHQSGEHLLELINDVLEMSKIEAGQATFTETDFDLYQLLATLESMFDARVRSKGVQLFFERALDVPQYIHTDERKLRQVLINLLNNAAKFTEQGSITLRVKQVGNGGLVKASKGRAHSCKLAFEIEDTGMGIAPEEMDRLFEAFTQTTSGQEALEGTGLGLPLSQRFVQLLGGDIAVSSKVGAGSLFRFDFQVGLPADVSAIEKRKARIQEQVVGLVPGQRAADGGPTDGGPYRILVVEDREASRVLLLQLLTAVGFEVREAVNGQEAVAVWQAWKPHLIWMDMRMPVMDGYEATKRIKSLAGAKSPAIIALTAHAFEEERAAILAAGCDDFVRKPFREAKIFDKMAQHLGLRYVYQDLDAGESDGGVQAPVDLTPSDLADLPPDWVAELYHAAARGHDKYILDLIEQIRPAHARVAEGLEVLVYEFRFDKLVALAKQ